MCASRLLLPLLLLAVSLPAQGVGTVGSNGLEPELVQIGRTVGSPCTLQVRNLPVAAGSSYSLALSSAPAAIDLSPAGLPGATLGLDPSPGALLVLPPLPVDAMGQGSLGFTVPPALGGTSLFAQVLVVDPGLAGVGLALSDSRVLSFGSTDATALVSIGGTPNAQSALRLFADASNVAPVSGTPVGFESLDLRITGSFDTLAMSGDRPWRDTADPSAPRIRFPGGTSLHRYRIGARHGVFLTRSDSAEFIRLFEIPGMLFPEIAVSPFEPLAAVVAENPVPAFGGATLFLVRTDGANFPGTASPVRAVAFPGLGAFAPEQSGVAFLQGSLVMSDGQSLVRLSTAPGSLPQLVAVPPVAGVAPAEVDDEFAVSADGSTAAFTAGASDTVRDVFIVQAQGSAINVTQNAGEYEPADFEDPDGALLALAPDGSRVAFIRRIGADEDIWIQDTMPGMPLTNLTTPALFGNSLETESGILFASRTTLLFTNGLSETQLDVYAASLPQAASGPVSVANVTVTSGLSAPPYSLGGTLRLLGRARLASGGVAYRMDDGPGTSERLVVIPSAGATPMVLTGLSGFASAGSSTGGWLAVNRASGAELFSLDATNGVTSELVLPAPNAVLSVAGLPAGASLLRVSTGGVGGVLLRDGAGTVTPLGGLGAGGALPGIGVASDGSLLLGETVPSGVRVLRVLPLSLQTVPLTTVGAAPRFL